MRPLSRIHLEELSDNVMHRAWLKLFGVNSAENRTIIYAFEDNTTSIVDVKDYIKNCERLPKGKKYYFINASCEDISKQSVSKWMTEVFGYATEVDPETYTEVMVRKSDTNGIHDGEEVQAPIGKDSVDPNSVYQKLIDTSVDANYVQDLRLVVIGDSIPVLYRKQRSITERFSNTNTTVYLENPHDYFSQEELENIVRFRQVSGLDVCELDVLRDNDNKKIYIVDVNRTISGPPNHITLLDSLKAIALMGNAFEKEYLESKKHFH